jgi:hypothetical protein
MEYVAAVIVGPLCQCQMPTYTGQLCLLTKLIFVIKIGTKLKNEKPENPTHWQNTELG